MVVHAGDEALETVVIHGVEEIHDATVAPEDAAEVTGTEIHEVTVVPEDAAVTGAEIHEVTVVPEDAAVTGAQAHEVAAVLGGRVAREAREALETLEAQDAPEGRAGDRNEEPLKRFLRQLRNSAIHHSLVFHRSSWLRSSQTNRKTACDLLLSNLDANPLTVSQKFHRHQISWLVLRSQVTQQLGGCPMIIFLITRHEDIAEFNSRPFGNTMCSIQADVLNS